MMSRGEQADGASTGDRQHWTPSIPVVELSGEARLIDLPLCLAPSRLFPAQPQSGSVSSSPSGLRIWLWNRPGAIALLMWICLFRCLNGQLVSLLLLLSPAAAIIKLPTKVILSVLVYKLHEHPCV